MKKQISPELVLDQFLKVPIVKHPDGKLVRGSNRSITFSNHRYTSSGGSSLAYNYSTGTTRVNGKKYN